MLSWRPVLWLREYLLLAGDIESNPGPKWICSLCNNIIKRTQCSLRCNAREQHWVHERCAKIKAEQYTEKWTCQQHKDKERGKRKINLTLLQLNINGIRNKLEELKEVVQKKKPHVIMIQETKLQKQHKTPILEEYSTVRCDRPQGNGGGGLLTYIHSNLQFRELTNFQTYINGAERSVVEIRDGRNFTLRLANIYIPPRDINADQDEIRTNQCIQELLTADTILAGDVNAHAPLWHSSITDARGIYIEELLLTSDMTMMNEETPTRIPFDQTQR
ncbi:hypothetical protein HAZT_HAZT009772 [Hyalella azteca]|uniref:Endonuclease/exonuclease/phosphatase domain-containing protein n=1 Tax=Hyalella azteca TaxID=294128 RepID=A0A6A0GSK5_HYAAZ|nr:hypothetical protein HAZT_HAZT009772 [Hyalella azteca]